MRCLYVHILGKSGKIFYRRVFVRQKLKWWRYCFSAFIACCPEIDNSYIDTKKSY